MQEAQERHMTMKGIEPVTWKELEQVLALCVRYPVFSPLMRCDQFCDRDAELVPCFRVG
jgi:hypothetical protein